MNDKLMMEAIRKLPAGWVSNDTNVARFGRGIVAANPNFAPMHFRDGQWKKLDPATRTRR